MSRLLFGGIAGELRRLLGVYLGSERATAAEEERPRYAVVLGTQVIPGGKPSRTLDARVRHAARLHAAGRVDRVLVTGGVGKHPPSEAEVMARILREEGVPGEAVRLEDEAKSTWDSARLVTDLAAEEGVAEALVVTDPLHCVRTVAAFRRAGLIAWAEPVYSSPMWRVPWLRRGQFLRESGALVWYRVRYGVGARSRR
ncbi:MAG: YdcF family protein [Actinomycetota bacterium]|nr:YdcF family protein [Actinomycetota bacterium]